MDSRYAHLVNGRWYEPTTEDHVDVINPATEKVFTRVPAASPADAEVAVRSARAAFDDGPWPRLTGKQRKTVLIRFAESLERHRDEIVDAVVAQGGCTIRQARGMQVYDAIGLMYAYADLADRDPVVMARFSGGPFGGTEPRIGHAVAVREPAGVVAAITPFNYPFHLNIQKIGPALAAGCTIVLKPTEYTCLDAHLIARIALEECDFPPGVLNILLGAKADVGEFLSGHPLVDQVTFTGSTQSGRKVMASAAATIKKVTLELGGKSANIIFSSADLDKALAGDAALAIRHSGQGCAQWTRVLVEDSIHDQVVDAMIARAQTVVVGDPTDDRTEMGPLISQIQYDRVRSYIASGLAEGAKLVVGGDRPSGVDQGFFLNPTVFTDVTPQMRIFQEEIFGPVVAVTRFADEEEAVSLANDSIFGLNGAVWSGDLAQGLRVAGRIRTGSISVNGGGNTDRGFPSGGYKQSGLGREYGTWAIDEYTELKTIRYSA